MTEHFSRRLKGSRAFPNIRFVPEYVKIPLMLKYVNENTFHFIQIYISFKMEKVILR